MLGTVGKIGTSIVMMLSLISAILGQTPGRAITVIVPYSPTTGIDILARAIGAELSNRWNQPVVIENKPGASGNIGTQIAARSAPDGHTLLMIAKTFIINPNLFKSVPYDPVKSFKPVIKLATGDLVLAVHPSLPVRSVADFVAHAKSHAGKINYGSAGFGTPHHLAMELFKHAAGVDLMHVPYRGTSGVVSDLVGNHVTAMFLPVHVALPLARDNQIRILAVANNQRVPAAPEVPSFGEQGMPGFEVDLWFGLLAPADTPDEIITRYNSAVNDILLAPVIAGAFARQGLVVAGGPPSVLAELILKDLQKWQKVLSDVGIKPE